MERNEKKEDNKRLTREILFGILGTDLIVIIVVSLFLFFKKNGISGPCCCSAILTFLATAMACIMVGIIVGFLFSIPRLNKEKGKDESERQPFYKDNTNLEEISDWLTKIIVGISLVEFNKILSMLHNSSVNLSYAFCCSLGNSGYYTFSYACILFFSSSGFGIGYIWTRIVFTEMLFESQNLIQRNNVVKDVAQAAIAQKKISLSKMAFSSNDLEKREIDNSISIEEKEQLIIFRDKVIEILKSKPILVADDLQKGRWGGKKESNGKVIQAVVKPSEELEGFYDILITIKNIDKTPLNLHIAVFVHNSYGFPNNAIYLKRDEKPQVEMLGYEAFTVGAYLEDGTELELDLNEEPDFPKEFYWDKYKKMN
jgi:hypothetical protein